MVVLNTGTCFADASNFAEDVAFLRRHTPVVVLESGSAAVAIAPAYQGRVMTSTCDQDAGPGFGWINRPVVERGVLSQAERKGRLEEHIHIFGGEERFWLGPEGGQFGIFFPPGSKFEFSHWRTPAAIDTEAFELVESTPQHVLFRHHCRLENFSGTRFDVGIERAVRILDAESIADRLHTALPPGVRGVGYETDNRIINEGDAAWNQETGLLSIWLLGMYNPSPGTTVVIPFIEGEQAERGPVVNDTYFGKVPADHLSIADGVLFFRGDGTRRGKIGVAAQRSKGVAGSFDAQGGVLTLVGYNVQEAPHGFVNSMWELQEAPYSGDVINSYNDGSPAPGEPPLGPFYELETSSPAAALQPGEAMRHVQWTLHLEGAGSLLDPIARQVLGVGIEKIASALGERGK
jgi:hypothetical protein